MRLLQSSLDLLEVVARELFTFLLEIIFEFSPDLKDYRSRRSSTSLSVLTLYTYGGVIPDPGRVWD